VTPRDELDPLVRPDPDELALIEAGFPGFRVWRQTVCDRMRYVAASRDLDTHPYTVITSDLKELVASLTAGRPAAGQPPERLAS
jgi:hypothetical protein